MLYFFRSTKKAMAAKFNWVWHPFGTMATPTLQRSLKPLLFAGAARRGGLQASGAAVARREVERRESKEEEELEVGGFDDNGSDFGPMIIDH